VWAPSLSRDDLWEALTNRRTCAVTGDKISALVRVNGAWPGMVVEDERARRYIEVEVCGQDFIDYAEVLKNETVLCRIPGKDPAEVAVSTQQEIEAKVRVEWGWGDQNLVNTVEGELTLLEGELVRSEPCFRGEHILSPDDTPGNDSETVAHRIIESSSKHCRWHSTMRPNHSSQHPRTQSLVATVRMRPMGRIRLRFNGLQEELALGELLDGSRSYQPHGWLGEALRIHRPVLQSHYTLQFTMEDVAEQQLDLYRLRVAQRNSQWAWTSPIWMVS
jgi:hypothetical protein